MKRNVVIANRLREVLLNGRWIANTNFREQLENTSYDQAIRKIGNLNSITQLTFHVNYYIAGLLKVLKGGNLDIHDKYSFDLPQLESEVAWQRIVAEFLKNAEDFSMEVETMEEDRLDQSFVKEEYGTYLRNIEGMIEHAYYHLGQVVLIQKMMNEN